MFAFPQKDKSVAMSESSTDLVLSLHLLCAP